MFERWLEKFLRKKVGEFLDGINKTNLKLGLFHGNVIIKKIAIKPKVFQKMGVPGNLKFSWVEKLSINIPWSLFGEKPILIVVEDLYALFESLEQESHVSEFLNEMDLRKRLKYINSLFAKTCKDKSSSRDKNKIKDKNRKILDQIQVNPSHILVPHLPYRSSLKMSIFALKTLGVNVDMLGVSLSKKFISIKCQGQVFRIKNMEFFTSPRHTR